MNFISGFLFIIGCVTIVLMVQGARPNELERIICNDDFSTGWKDIVFLNDGTIHFRNHGGEWQIYRVTEGSLCLHQTREKEES